MFHFNNPEGFLYYNSSEFDSNNIVSFVPFIWTHHEASKLGF